MLACACAAFPDRLDRIERKPDARERIAGSGIALLHVRRPPNAYTVHRADFYLHRELRRKGVEFLSPAEIERELRSRGLPSSDAILQWSDEVAGARAALAGLRPVIGNRLVVVFYVSAAKSSTSTSTRSVYRNNKWETEEWKETRVSLTATMRIFDPRTGEVLIEAEDEESLLRAQPPSGCISYSGTPPGARSALLDDLFPPFAQELARLTRSLPGPGSPKP